MKKGAYSPWGRYPCLHAHMVFAYFLIVNDVVVYLQPLHAANYLKLYNAAGILSSTETRTTLVNYLAYVARRPFPSPRHAYEARATFSPHTQPLPPRHTHKARGPPCHERDRAGLFCLPYAFAYRKMLSYPFFTLSGKQAMIARSVIPSIKTASAMMIPNFSGLPNMTMFWK